METLKNNSAAESTVKNINTGKDINTNAPKATITQTSKKAQELLAKAAAKKASETAPKEAVKNVAEKAPTAKKEPKVTIASKFDEVLTKGGKWENMLIKVQAAVKELGGNMKVNIGTLKAHINFRMKTQKKADYLGNLKVTEEGIVAKVAKVKKEKAVA